MAKSVSQSNTMWVKKGTIVNGKAVPKGYLAQYGKPEKKVSANVKMVVDTGGVKAGKTQEYKQGRRTKAAAAAPNGGGRPGGGGGGGGGSDAPKFKPQSMKAAGKSAGRRQAAMSAERSPVKAPSSAGRSAGMSSYRPMASTAKSKNLDVASPKAGGARPRGVSVPTQNVKVNGKTTRIAKTGIRGLGNQRVYDVPGAIATVATSGIGGGMAGRIGAKVLSKTPIGKLAASVGEGAKEGIASLGRSAASSAPKAAKAAKVVTKPTASGKKGGINAMVKGVNKETGSVKSARSKTPMGPAEPKSPAQKAALTRYANQNASRARLRAIEARKARIKAETSAKKKGKK